MAGVALVVVVLLLGGAASWVAASNARAAEQRYAAQIMDRYTSDLGRAFSTGIRRYGDTLTDLAIALGSQSDLTSNDFTWITNKVSNRRLPGATAIGFVVAAPAAVDVAALQASWRAAGATDLVLQPGVTGGDHAFGVFARSFDNSPVTAGVDLAADPESAAVLRDAELLGGLAVSRPFVLPKDRGLTAAQRQLSFMLAVPVFHIGGAFRGWLVMGVRGPDLLVDTLRTQTHGGVTAELTDATEATEVSVAGARGRAAAGYPAALDRTTKITAGLRTWRLDIHPTEQLLGEINRGTVGATLAVSMTITLLLAALVALLAGARNRAMSKVDAATAALRGDIERRQAVETRLRERELELQRLALHDPLTGLANRAGLDQRLAETVGRRTDIALLLIDLDDFKLVNDLHGHAAGDAMLTEFARQLLAGLRDGDVAARIGGDEFVVLLTGVPGPAEAVAAAERILATAAAAPVRLGSDTLPVRASIGVTTGRPGDCPKDLLRRADIAMYQAKHLGTHGVLPHDASMVDRRAADAQLGEDLAVALVNNELHVLYQPLVGLTDGRPVGVEALVRWQHPRLGVVPPSVFVPIAERNGTITAIGLYVLEEACRQAREWEGLYASVNMSPRQLQEPTVVQDVLDVLARTGLPPERLVLEITESALVDESAGIAKLSALRAHGIRVAIDDFGTGYSSLHYLTRLPVDILKIDRSFVAELNGTPEGSGITDAILRLSQVLHLTTVAEGIETPAQAAELQMLGCSTGQGYLFAEPLPATGLQELLLSPVRRP